MPIRFTCPHCGVQTNVADEFAGQSGPCAHCGKTITVPLPATAGMPAPGARSSGTPVLVVVLVVALVVVVGCGGILLALLLPAVQAAREAARRAQCSNNLKQIALAMHNYHAANNCLPPAYLANKDGKPMHSWRVLLLPYLEQNALYSQYRFDEPWDSPNNSALAGIMPSVYACPSNATAQANGQTSYMVITGPGTVFEDAKACSFADITDGTSNTLMVVEVSGKTTNWMQPQDVSVDEITQTMLSPPGVARSGPDAHPGGFQASLCDGSVRFMSDAIDLETFKRLVEKADGQALDYGDF